MGRRETMRGCMGRGQRRMGLGRDGRHELAFELERSQVLPRARPAHDAIAAPEWCGMRQAEGASELTRSG
jgi:hypothetical protein